MENIFINKKIFLLVILVMNLLSYFLYGLDKKRAMKKKKRISEKTLFFISFLFGGIGALFGMKQFHHKTKKLKFKLLVPIAAAITFAGLIFTII